MTEISGDEGNHPSKPRLVKARKMNDQCLIIFPGTPGDYYSVEFTPGAKQVIYTKVETHQDARDALLGAYLKVVQQANPSLTVEEARGFVIATLEKQIRERR